jgi:hypothetical protein
VTDTAATPTPIPAPPPGDDARPGPALVPPLDEGAASADVDGSSPAFEVEWVRADELPAAAADVLADNAPAPSAASEQIVTATPIPAPTPVPAATPIPGPTAPRPGATPSPVAVAAAARRSPDRRRRVVRRVEPKSVAKVSLVFYACVFVALLVAGVILWIAAAGAGIVENVESFIGDLFALDEFRFEPMRILQATFLGGAVLVLLGTAANVVATLLFNLIADLVGGVEISVVDDEAAEPARRSVV